MKKKKKILSFKMKYDFYTTFNKKCRRHNIYILKCYHEHLESLTIIIVNSSGLIVLDKKNVDCLWEI